MAVPERLSFRSDGPFVFRVRADDDLLAWHGEPSQRIWYKPSSICIACTTGHGSPCRTPKGRNCSTRSWATKQIGISWLTVVVIWIEGRI